MCMQQTIKTGNMTSNAITSNIMKNTWEGDQLTRENTENKKTEKSLKPLYTALHKRYKNQGW